MTEDRVHAALLRIECGLNLVDAARQTLIIALDDIGSGFPANLVECVLCTLETASKEGRDGLDVVREAMSEKAT